jgi:hypothetical protein
MKPTATGRALFGDSASEYISVWSAQVKAKASDPEDVVASLSLPYTLPWQERVPGERGETSELSSFPLRLISRPAHRYSSRPTGRPHSG